MITEALIWAGAAVFLFLVGYFIGVHATLGEKKKKP